MVPQPTYSGNSKEISTTSEQEHFIVFAHTPAHNVPRQRLKQSNKTGMDVWPPVIICDSVLRLEKVKKKKKNTKKVVVSRIKKLDIFFKEDLRL